MGIKLGIQLKSIRKRQKEFVAAYKKHADALYRFCSFKLSDRELAKDVLQDTFTKAWAYIAEHGNIKNIKAFLYKITSNLIIDEYRKRKHNDSLEVLQETTGFDPAFDDTERWVDKIDGKQALDLLKKIPEPYNEALFMRYVQELSLTEIAKLTGEHENAIAVRIHRGIAKLKELFANKEKEVTRDTINNNTP